jgi:glycosyltransferase involved in cell wall biosynthesis
MNPKLSHPLVTVYIATHNRSALLVRAVESVLAQSYSNIELIVADDGSADDTYEQLLPYINSSRVIYVKNDSPQGACVARNLAIDIAKGELITGLDDDDEFLPNRVSHMVDLFSTGQYSCIASPYVEVTPKGEISRKLDCGLVTLDKLLHYNVLGNQVLTSTSNLRAIRGFSPKMPAFQDYDTWVRLVSKFGDAYKSDEISYVWYTDHVSGRISQSSEKRISAFELFNENHKYLMSPRHINSMTILDKRLKAESYSLFEFISMTNKDNYKASLSYFINSNFRFVKWAFDNVRLLRKQN